LIVFGRSKVAKIKSFRNLTRKLGFYLGFLEILLGYLESGICRKFMKIWNGGAWYQENSPQNSNVF
jgi:hypothetical protein